MGTVTEKMKVCLSLKCASACWSLFLADFFGFQWFVLCFPGGVSDLFPRCNLFVYLSLLRLLWLLLVADRAVFKWLSKVIKWLLLLRSVIGLKDSRHFFSQWESKPKPMAPRTRDFSRASSELQLLARNCDWFIALPAPVVIGRSNCFGFGFSTVIWKPLYWLWISAAVHLLRPPEGAVSCLLQAFG